MKKHIPILILISLCIAILSITLVVCSSKTKVYKTSDNLYEISLPKSETWTDNESRKTKITTFYKQSNSNIVVAINSNPLKEKTFDTEYYCKSMLIDLRSSYPHFTFDMPKSVEINTMKGHQYIYTLDSPPGNENTYISTVLTDGNNFISLVLKCKANDFEKNKSELYAIINSLKKSKK